MDAGAGQTPTRGQSAAAADRHSFGRDFILTLITSDPRLAGVADRAGVNRIGVDLEYLGKAERQRGRDTRISRHGWRDLEIVRGAVGRAEIFARINPVHPGTRDEIEIALSGGATVLMLPNFESAAEVARFADAVRGRARVVILVERAAAVARIREILDVGGVDEVMLGLNDLHLEFRLANHFEVLASPLVDMLAAEVHARGLPLGIGGVGRVDDDSLPVAADLVFAQYPRLSASAAWLARCFAAPDMPPQTFARAVRALRSRLAEWAGATPESLDRARRDLALAAARWRRTPPPALDTRPH